ncbi:MAG: phosphoribosyl-AMP cyclohydrolase [SAR324 cluster bacterium]|nr:phosphoribosyl-AMP cyclohydrolase [SAR324 cluster bacterium]
MEVINLTDNLDFDKLRKIARIKTKVLPVVVQNWKTMAVIMIGYVNQEALDYSLTNKIVAFWSTSKDKLWIKGKTSGDYLKLIEVRLNCENNSLLFLVELQGKGACHAKDAQGNRRVSCYYHKIKLNH